MKLILVIINILLAQSIDWDENGVPIRQGTHIEWMRTADTGFDGELIYCWSDTRTGGRDIYAQKIDNSGQKIWNEDVVVARFIGRQEDPQLVSDNNGGAFIIWNDYRAEENNFANPPAQLFAQHISSGGVVSWAESGVSLAHINHTQQAINICRDGLGGNGVSGGAYVIWSEEVDQEKITYATHLTPNQSEIINPGSGVVIIDHSTGYDVSMSLETGPDGDAVMAWKDLRNGDTNTNIYAQRIGLDGDGNLVTRWSNTDGGGLPICTADGNQAKPRVSYYNEEYSIIVWEDYRLDFLSGSNQFGADIFAQFINVEGLYPDLYQENGNPVTVYNSSQTAPRVKSNSSGAYVIWNDARASYNDVFIQKINHNISYGNWERNYDLLSCEGTPLSSMDYYCLDGYRVDGKQISLIDDYKNQEEVRLSADGNGVWVVWEDQEGSNPATLDIYTQHITSEGDVSFTEGGLLVSNENYAQEKPIIRSDGLGGAFAIWQDRRTGSTGIFSQFINLTSPFNQFTDNGLELISGIDWYSGLLDNEFGSVNKSKNRTKSIHIDNESTLIYWMDDRETGSINYNGSYWTTHHTYGSIINSDYNIDFNTVNGVKLSNYVDQQYPKINKLNNGYFLTFVGYDVTEAQNRIMFEVLNADLSFNSDEPIPTNPNYIGNEEYSVQNNFSTIIGYDDYIYNAYDFTDDSEEATGNRFPRVMIQKVDQAGIKQWQDDVLVAMESYTSIWVKSIHPHPLGGAIVVYQRDSALDDYKSVITCYINSSGEIIWEVSLSEEMQVSQDYFDSIDFINGVYIVYTDPTQSLDGTFNIYGQLLDFDGNRVGDTNGDSIANHAFSDQTSASLDVNDQGDQLFICWEDSRNGIDLDIYCKFINILDNSSLIYSDEIILSSLAIDQMNPYVKSTQNGTFLVAWEHGSESIYSNIYIQEIAEDYLGFQASGQLLCDAVHDQKHPQIQLLSHKTDNSVLSYLVYWTDYRSSGKAKEINIFGQRVILENDLSIINSFVPNGIVLHSNFPNPFNPTTTISFTISNITKLNLIVYDINGREITKLMSGIYTANNYSIIWDGTDHSGNKVASGVYFATLKADIGILDQKMVLIK